MEGLSFTKLCTELEKLTDFLKFYHDLTECHLVDYFTTDMQKIIDRLITNDDVFIKECARLYSIGCCYSTTDHHSKYCIEEKNQFFSSLRSQTADKCIGVKKHYEVKRLAPFINMLATDFNSKKIVDLGSGKGYLGHELSTCYELQVVGVEGSPDYAKSAEKRQQILNEVIQQDGACYYQTIQYKLESIQVSSVSGVNDFMEKIQQTFKKVPQQDNCLMLVGLHTCGDLASRSLKLYKTVESFKGMCVVGCCYNLIEDNSFLSGFLRDKCISLGKHGKMLACQSPIKWNATDMKLQESLLYRAILEKILIDKGITSNNLKFRRIGKRSSSFAEYIMKLKRLPQNTRLLSITDSDIEVYWTRHKHDWNKMKRFHKLRMQLAPCIEKLILLDRLMYLLESGLDQSCVVRVFSPTISPRCYALISSK